MSRKWEMIDFTIWKRETQAEEEKGRRCDEREEQRRKKILFEKTQRSTIMRMIHEHGRWWKMCVLRARDERKERCEEEDYHVKKTSRKEKRRDIIFVWKLIQNFPTNLVSLLFNIVNRSQKVCGWVERIKIDIHERLRAEKIQSTWILIHRLGLALWHSSNVQSVA